MKDPAHIESVIEDVMRRNKGLFSNEDFKECRQAVTDFEEVLGSLEAMQYKFRRKLSEAAANDPHNKEKLIYLQGLVDGINLVEGPLRRFMHH
ncbi:hypothetical protein O9H85_28125 [Paenibacillus filicis]|uniref:Uncharacterized protein n=1 Tax=Paenibacillus gyeongsangnamensis TaxID=3388067 RepID=A0ABT4QH20_9BACL|nr:hypothetical protein [Paenibacillus filicis]MCZ8516192.1 hypothetical protein [Paenibacillus filicis]